MVTIIWLLLHSEIIIVNYNEYEETGIMCI